ncbi:hypothetical protein RUM44_013145 [Polyplax serrata]|uniref:Uncharacterized protein n=1 Tax=Polyplax serrata TaxID=468196 RepID=A0ABR1BF93_POLSC
MRETKAIRYWQYGFTGTHESSCGDAQGNLFNQSAEPGAQQNTREVPDCKIDDLQTESHIEKNENVNSTESEIKSDVSTESNSRCKSYDQGWRTTKPPPPPLFDDDCDDDVDDWLH